MKTEKITANRNLGAGGTALRWAVVLVALPLLLAAVPAPAEGLGPTGCKSLLINGSFEVTPQPVHNNDFDQFSDMGGADVAGWVLEAGDAIEIQRNLRGAAADGDHWLELAANERAQISQSPVGAVPGALYELRFAYSARPGSEFAGDNRFRVTWGSASEPLQVERAVGTTTWQYASITAAAPAGGSKVLFQDLSKDNGAGMLIDDVTLCRVPGLAQKCCCGGNEVYAFTEFPHLSWALLPSGNLLRLWWDQFDMQQELAYERFNQPLVSGSLRRDPFGDGVLALSDRGDIVRAVESAGTWSTELVLPGRLNKLGRVRSCAMVTTFGGGFPGIYVVTKGAVLRIYQDAPGGAWKFSRVQIGRQVAAQIVPTSLHEIFDGRIVGVLANGQRWNVWFEDNDPRKMRFDLVAGDLIAVSPAADCGD